MHLQDWPPSTDFETAFPELFDDFSMATPMPNHVCRAGVLSIASHFPSNAIGPDLGAPSYQRLVRASLLLMYVPYHSWRLPGMKMYNAMASFESQGSKGLHAAAHGRGRRDQHYNLCVGDA